MHISIAQPHITILTSYANPKQKTPMPEAHIENEPAHPPIIGKSLPEDKRIRLTHSMSSGALLQTKLFKSLKEDSLTRQFSSSQPARGKVKDNERRSPIQADEKQPLKNGDWQTRVNPTRLRVTKDRIISNDGTPLTSDLSRHLPIDKILTGEVSIKWGISKNGTLFIGQTKVPNAEGNESGKSHLKLGHPTLVGGMKIPEARISGMLYANSDGKLAINNDSGRFSEYEDRKPAHLTSVAEIFKNHNLPVETEWMQVKTIPLARS